MGGFRQITERNKKGGKFMIIVENVTKKQRNKTILENVNLTIDGVYGLIGPNGAGKTTLMRALAGLVSIQSGTIKIEEESAASKLHDFRKNIGYLPQDFNTFPKLTVWECLDHIAILKGLVNKKERNARVLHVLEEVNLLDKKNIKMFKLSGGMRKRVGIAQMFLTDPDILVLDEPTAGLDIYERIRFRNLLLKISLNRTVIITSHIVEDIEFLCTKIGVLSDGQVLKEGLPQEITELAKGRVWNIKSDKDQLSLLLVEYDVINITQLDNGSLDVRVLSDVQPVNSTLAKPKLIDGYVSLISGMEEARNARI